MRNNACVCVVMRFVLLKPVKTPLRHFSACVSFYCFVPRIRKVYVCGGLGAVHFGVETSDCHNIPSCVIWLSVSENSSLFSVLMTRFPSEKQKNTHKKKKPQICSTFLSKGEMGMKKCESCKSVIEMDHFKAAGVTFVPHICWINTFWNDWWIFCFCRFVSPSVRSPPLSWLMPNIYLLCWSLQREANSTTALISSNMKPTPSLCCRSEENAKQSSLLSPCEKKKKINKLQPTSWLICIINPLYCRAKLEPPSVFGTHLVLSFKCFCWNHMKLLNWLRPKSSTTPPLLLRGIYSCRPYRCFEGFYQAKSWDILLSKPKLHGITSPTSYIW